MAYPLKLAKHFTPDELYQHFRACSAVVERAHGQIIWLKSQGKPTPEIKQATGYSPNSIRRIIHRSNDQGADGLPAQRHDHAGAEDRSLDRRKDPTGERAQSARLGLSHTPRLHRPDTASAS